jgi:type IV secretion system protein VirB6
MSQCQPFGVDGPSGVADALSKVDCMASDATSVSFGRLFGAHGSFTTALTIILTLYIALLAFNLLTGRSALRLSVLTPRMMTLGLVLTFATSWVAYQSVVWNLATGAPDEIASVLVGTNGSATSLFANQLDQIFGTLNEVVAHAAPGSVAAAASSASPANILSYGALLLLLGTVGVLVVCRLALAALLILGPVFIVLALFEGTRGLFQGWLKCVATFALVPLLTVVMGSGALGAISPMVAGLAQNGAEIPLKTAVSILVASIIYLSLMLLVFKVAAMLTKGWRMGRSQQNSGSHGAFAFGGGYQERPLAAAPAMIAAAVSPAIGSDRVRSTVASLEVMTSNQRLALPSASALSVPVSAPVPALAAPAGAQAHLRYLHHRVAGAPNHASREIVR